MVTNLVTEWSQTTGGANLVGASSAAKGLRTALGNGPNARRVGGQHITERDVFRAKPLILKEKAGVADGTRTHDNRNHNPGLYQLSYSHHSKNLACPTGIEPVTLSLEG